MSFLTFEQFCTEFDDILNEKMPWTNEDYQPDVPMLYFDYILELKEENEAKYDQWFNGLSILEQSDHLFMMFDCNLQSLKKAILNSQEIDTNNLPEYMKEIHQRNLEKYRQIQIALLESDLEL